MTLMASGLLYFMEDASDEEGRQSLMESINASRGPLANMLDIITWI